MTWLVGEPYARRMTTIMLKSGLFREHMKDYNLFNQHVYILHKLLCESIMEIIDC